MVLGSCSLFVCRCWIPFWIYIYIYILISICLFLVKEIWCPLHVVIFAHCKLILLSWLFSCLSSCVRCIFFSVCFCLLSSYLRIWFVFSNSSIISFFWHASLSHFTCGSIIPKPISTIKSGYPGTLQTHYFIQICWCIWAGSELGFRFCRELGGPYMWSSTDT